MFPKALLAYSVECRRLEPQYLTAADYPWLRALLEAHSRCVGRRRRDLQHEVARGLGVQAPPAKLRMAAHLVERLTTDRVVSPTPPRRIRAALFRRAATMARDEALTVASAELDVTAEDVEACVFADLPGERIVQPLGDALCPAALAAKVNTALVASLLKRATRVTLTAHGNVRALVRHAKLVGLLCVVDVVGDRMTMQLSGPYALFRRTLVYGRALASLLPRLAWCRDFQLVAELAADVPDGEVRAVELVVTPAAPIEAGEEMRRFDSAIEERFVRELGRLTKDWHIVREPHALPTKHGLFFPDFELVLKQALSAGWRLF